MTWPEWDTSLLLAINSNHNNVLDQLMWWVSKPWVWLPLYVYLCAVFVKNYGWNKTIYLLLAFGALILCTDFLNLHCIKNTVQRLRPTHDARLSGMLHLITDDSGQPYLGGTYGFISSHAANHFGLAFLFTALTKNFIRGSAVIFYLWACIIAYSRIYMGVHYPLDVIGGAAFGLCAGALIHYFIRRFSLI